MPGNPAAVGPLASTSTSKQSVVDRHAPCHTESEEWRNGQKSMPCRSAAGRLKVEQDEVGTWALVIAGGDDDQLVLRGVDRQRAEVEEVVGAHAGYL